MLPIHTQAILHHCSYAQPLSKFNTLQYKGYYMSSHGSGTNDSSLLWIPLPFLEIDYIYSLSSSSQEDRSDTCEPGKSFFCIYFLVSSSAYLSERNLLQLHEPHRRAESSEACGNDSILFFKLKNFREKVTELQVIRSTIFASIKASCIIHA